MLIRSDVGPAAGGRGARRGLSVLAAILAGVVLLFAGEARARTFTLSSFDDVADAAPGDGVCATAGGVCAFRAAIEEANAFPGADTIVMPPGTYLVLSLLPDITTDVTIRGAGVARTVLDANYECGLTFAPPEGVGALNVSGVRFFRCSAAIYCTGGTVNVDSCVFEACRGARGGALLFIAGTLNVTNSTIEKTVSTRPTSTQGGIWIAGATATFRNCTIRDNAAAAPEALVAAMGGGIYCEGAGVLRILDSTLTGNRAFGVAAVARGGAIFADGCTLDVRGSTIAGNAAISSDFEALNVGAEGGGIYAVNSTVTIRDSRIRDNAALGSGSASHGGGLYVAGTSSASLLRGSSIAQNTVGTSGGGVFVEPTATFSKSADSVVRQNHPDNGI